MKTSSLLITIILSINLSTAQYTKFVDPFIGTGGHGHTFPGPVLPFGMVQLSPDTRIDGWDGCSGYHYTDSIIYGFSHTHLSGTGVPDYCDILIMPGSESIPMDSMVDFLITAQAFDKKSEEAFPGYYKVHLKKDHIDVRLTATLRTGVHEYKYSSTQNNWIMIDLKHRDKVIQAAFTKLGSNEISGYRISSGWAKRQQVFFHLKTSSKITRFYYSKDSLKLFCQFEKIKGKKLILQCAISPVDSLGAKTNLESEWANFKFNDVLKSSNQIWNTMLGRIDIKESRKEKKDKLVTFYTALYHCLIHPSLHQDADGRYFGMDQQIHKGDILHPRYTVFSLWDTYRAAHPLYQFIYPEYNLNFALNFLEHYKECGRMPVWELASNETFCMIGNHSIPVLANVYLQNKTKTQFSKEEVVNAIQSTLDKSYSNIDSYRSGFISMEVGSESVSKTIENALDFSALKAVAGGNIKEEKFYQNLYNPLTGFFQPKRANRFSNEFDPYRVDFNYTEANAWQYLFGAHHDIQGMVECFNVDVDESRPGKSRSKNYFVKKLEIKLDSLFETKKPMTGRVQPDITGLIGQYAHGNEPSHHVAYLYNYCNRSDKTQKRVQYIIDHFYSNQPDGLCGNEDCGQMSAWYVFSCLGFYPVNPIFGKYQIGIPQFEQVRIKTPEQKEIMVECVEHKKFKELNQVVINRINQTSEITIKPGDHIVYKFGSKPLQLNLLQSRSLTNTTLPFILKGNEVFTNQDTIVISSLMKTGIEYTTDTLSGEIMQYTNPIIIDTTTKLFFRNKAINAPVEKWNISDFNKRSIEYIGKLISAYDPQYSAGGSNALFDGLQGSSDFRDGRWQGFWNKDVEIELELTNTSLFQNMEINCLQDQGPWILMPRKVDVYFSDDGKTYDHELTQTHDISPLKEGSITYKFNFKLIPGKKYIRIKLNNAGKLPEGHLSAGQDSWLFVDEIKLVR